MCRKVKAEKLEANNMGPKIQAKGFIISLWENEKHGTPRVWNPRNWSRTKARVEKRQGGSELNTWDAKKRM